MNVPSKLEPLVFGRFVVDAGDCQLFVDGKSVRVGAKAFALLLVLVEQRGRLVTKDKLLERVWPGIVVEENTLQVHISALRRILGPQVIATVPGRGYRFTALLHVDEGAAAIATPAAIPAGEPATIAVLPLLRIGSDADDEVFARGITEGIITELSRWRSLKVASYGSIHDPKEVASGSRRIWQELGVQFLVEGSVLRMGESLRVTVQLVDGRSGYQIWGERFDRTAAEPFAVQDEIVHTIVGTVVGRVYAAICDQTRRKLPSHLSAYEHMLRGNALQWDDPDSAAEAKRAFERAIELDPGFALAHSLLAVMLEREAQDLPADSAEPRERAFRLAKRAVELADDESTCHTILGGIYLWRRSFDLALHHTQRGIDINPVNQWNRADLGIVLTYIGRADEALEALRDARRFDPYFGPRWYWRALGLTQFVLRRYADAVPDFERGIVRKSVGALAMLAGCYAKLGRGDRARETVAMCLVAAPDATIEKLVGREPFKNDGDRTHMAECLRLAGMPAHHGAARGDGLA